MSTENSLPHSDDLSEILRLRREKLTKLDELRVNPYPYRFEKDSRIPDLLADFDSKIESEEHVGQVFSIAGRIHTIRVMGKAAFCHVRDEFGQMQVYVQRDRVGDENYALFKLLDIGDIIGVSGTAFRTKTGEATLRAQEFALLAKSLHPLPVVKEREGQVFDAFTDKEARYRQRYVDLAVNPDVREIFRVRARVISAMREFLDGRGYLEVETPVLQPLYGGALARPFTTYYNSLDRNFFLRIADELYLKRLLVGGFEKVYEICKDFRNEGMDKFHNPEFTMLEFYEAYSDYRDLMNLAEELFRHVARAALGTTEVTYQGVTVDFGTPFRRARFFDLLKDATGHDLLAVERRELGEIAKSKGVEVTKEMGEGKLLDEMMKTLVRPNLQEPTFIYDYPLSLSPLAKKHREDARLVERFQPFALGFELGNAFSELNDPLDQRARFESQKRLKEAGDEETQPLDEDFLYALEIGMPPTAGMGIGVDRLVMLLTDQPSIREVILFPQLRDVSWFEVRKEVYRIAKRIEAKTEGAIKAGGGNHVTGNMPESGQKVSYETIDILLKKWVVGDRASRLVCVILHGMDPAEEALRYIAEQEAKDNNLSHVAGVIVVVRSTGLVETASRDSFNAQVPILSVQDVEMCLSLLSENCRWIRNNKNNVVHRPWCNWGLRVSRKNFETEDIASGPFCQCCVAEQAKPTK